MPLTHEHRFEALERARRYYESRDFTALVESLEPLDPADREAEPELGLLLALGWHGTGRGQDALELVRTLAPLCVKRGNDKIGRRRLNLEATLLFERGDVSGAETAWQGLLAVASRAEDASYVAHANNNLAIIWTLRGEYDRALAGYGRAVAAYTRLGDVLALGEAHHNQGMSYRAMNFAREADYHFRRAIDFVRNADREDRVALAEQERALTLLYLGDAELASRMAEQALARSRRLGDRAAEAESLRALGLIMLAMGDDVGARQRFDEAFAMAADLNRPLLEAEALVARAAILELMGNEEAAHKDDKEAERTFEALGAVPWGVEWRKRVADAVGKRASESTDENS